MSNNNSPKTDSKNLSADEQNELRRRRKLAQKANARTKATHTKHYIATMSAKERHLDVLSWATEYDYLVDLFKEPSSVASDTASIFLSFAHELVSDGMPYYDAVIMAERNAREQFERTYFSVDPRMFASLQKKMYRGLTTARHALNWAGKQVDKYAVK